MTENQLTITFGGQGNIKVETLTDFLNNYKNLLFEINQELGYSQNDLVIEVSPPENGSFRIKISPKYEKVILNSLAALVVTTLSGIIIYHSTKPDSQDDSLEEIRKVLEKRNITDPKIQKNVYNVYNNYGAKQQIHQTFVIVDNDQNITKLKIQKDHQEIIELNKFELSKISSTPIIEKIKNTDENLIVDNATLIVKTIHFEGKGKWAFIFRGYPIKAIISDEEFKKKLNNEAFRKGDSLEVILSRKQYFDEDLQTFIVDQNSYSVVKVIRHISRFDSTQNLLDL